MRQLVIMAVFAFTVVATQFLAVPNASAEDVYLGTSDTTGRATAIKSANTRPSKTGFSG